MSKVLEGRCGRFLVEVICWSGLLVLMGSVQALGQPPIGAEFQVNTYTTYYQGGSSAGGSFYTKRKDVAMAEDQGFVVVWQDEGTSYIVAGQDGSAGGIFGQRFSASGIPLSIEFQINTRTSGNQSAPAVAMNDAGEFVVVWSSSRQFDSGQNTLFVWAIYGQRFEAQGATTGSEFTTAFSQLEYNLGTPGALGYPDVAMADNSPFIVTWQSGTNYGDGATDVWAQRYSDTGQPTGAGFRINSNTSGYQSYPRVAAASDGDFVIVWQDGRLLDFDCSSVYGGDGSCSSIEARLFGSDGSPTGAQFQINAYATGPQARPSVGAAGDGSFVVSWTDSPYYDVYSNQYVGRYGLTARRFNPSGGPEGAEFRVPSAPANYDGAIRVHDLSVERSGNFIVSWNAYYTTGDDNGPSIQARSFGADGVPWGPDFQVNSYTTGPQNRPAVAGQASAKFVIVWDDAYNTYSNGQDGSLGGTFGQLFGSAQIFSDGFESGDTTNWSAAVP